MTTHIRLVRHPETMIPAGVCTGRMEVPLTAGGRAALPSLIIMAHAYGPDSVISSDADRCRETAHALSRPLDLPVTLNTNWREIDFGSWEGRRWEDIEQEDPAGYWDWMEHFDQVAPPGGESFRMLQARVVTALETLIARGGRHLVVTHAGPIRAALAWVENRPLRQAYEVQVPYSSVFDLIHQNGKWERVPYFYPGPTRPENGGVPK